MLSLPHVPLSWDPLCGICLPTQARAASEMIVGQGYPDPLGEERGRWQARDWAPAPYTWRQGCSCFASLLCHLQTPPPTGYCKSQGSH